MPILLPLLLSCAPPSEPPLARAERLFSEGEALRPREDVESRTAALDLYRQAWTAEEGLDAPLLQARTLARMGECLYELGEVDEALAQYEQALERFADGGEPAERAELLNALAEAHRQRGEPGLAREYFERALETSKAAGDREGVATALNNLGVLEDSLNDPQAALGYYDQARAGYQELGKRDYEASTLHNIGIAYMSLGREAEALDVFAQTLAIREAENDRHGLPVTLTARGLARQKTGDADGALADFNQALDLRRAAGDRQGEAVTLELRGELFRERGDWDAARASFEEALDRVADTGNRINLAHLLTQLGRLDVERGEPAAALASLHRALEIFRQIDDGNGQVDVLAASARALRLQGETGAARERVEEAVRILESVRSRLLSTSFRSTYLASHHDVYRLLVELEMDLGHDARAFDAAERSRARSLLDRLSAARTEATPENRTRARELRDAVNAKEALRLRLASAGDEPERVAELEREIGALLVDYERLGKSGGEVAEPMGSEAIRSELLDDDTLLLAYALGEKRSFLWVLSRDALTSFVLQPGSEIDTLARRFHDLLPRSHERGFGRQAALVGEALSKAVLAPGAKLFDRPRLVILADGALQSIPFAALPLPGSATLLIEKHEIATVPSASVVAALRRRGPHRSGSVNMAVIADPVFSADDKRLTQGTTSPPSPTTEINADLQRSSRDFGIDRFDRLPYSRDEAIAILALVPPERSFAALNFDASRETVLEHDWRRFRFLHFATHGLLNDRHPFLSGIVLSLVDASGKPRNGFLRADEIEDLDLDADVVVLSACRTALGTEERGEGLLGLSQAFFDAGASTAVVSFWNVSDQATAELMVRFYRALIRDAAPPARALRQAQLSMLAEKQWQAPYFWAAFTVQGDWR